MGNKRFGGTVVLRVEAISTFPSAAALVAMSMTMGGSLQPGKAMAMGLGDQDTASVFEVLKKTIIPDIKPGNK